jgi:hypothetical protein
MSSTNSPSIGSLVKRAQSNKAMRCFDFVESILKVSNQLERTANRAPQQMWGGNHGLLSGG